MHTLKQILVLYGLEILSDQRELTNLSDAINHFDMVNFRLDHSKHLVHMLRLLVDVEQDGIVVDIVILNTS